eukprot:CAMPEP_0203644516 /NCGR_PEP_ID=MMETSP0088-20131115/9939_1 /ASSEMBLY_ACC=CAM_ASM_001087 /TAXON_ID=426623 /ORGANISM="Chaetoceros affinis, Strain CCMP159" /LENGTH=39 /DNA_ID= /DNA_START= /DNA_END= /DNA_ORIENTATION=
MPPHPPTESQESPDHVRWSHESRVSYPWASSLAPQSTSA